MLDSEADLTRPTLELGFEPDDALAAIASGGCFLFQAKADKLQRDQHRLLDDYRLKFTLPLFSQPPAKFDMLGTGTLFEHENRFFVVTADHIFRHDVDDPSSELIDVEGIGVPEEPRDSDEDAAQFVTLGEHRVWRIPPPVLLDVIVVELLDEAVTEQLRRGWSFLPFSQAEPPRDDDDRFVITGFMAEGATIEDGFVRQAKLNLETDYLHFTPALKNLVPEFDVFFYLHEDGTTVDGSQRTVTTLRGLSGGPIWAVRDIASTDLWLPSKTMKIVATQSSESARNTTWARGFRWEAVQQILRQPELGFRNAP